MSETAGSTGEKGHQRAQALFSTGNDASLKNNLDYAISMYREALKLEPNNLLFRQALRGAQRRQFGNEPGKVGMLAGARNQPIRLRANSAKNKGKWLEAIETCEDAFSHNPWDYHAAMISAEAAEGMGWPVLSKWLLESVAAQGTEDVNYLRHLARSYEKNEDWDRSIACWEKLRKLSPSDDEAIRKIRGLEASATISRSGLGDAIQRADHNSQAPEAPLPPDIEEMKRQALSPEDRLRKDIEADPRRVGLYLDLADLLKKANKLDEAEKVLAQGIRENPEDEVLREAHGNMQIARLQRAIAAWRKKLREQPDDPAIRQKVAQLSGMLSEYQVKEYRRRVELRPDAHQLRLQLGQVLAQAQKWDEAIAELQKVRGESDVKVQALYLTGQCFESKVLPKLAERNYLEALKVIDEGDQELFNKLHYRLGRVAEAQGDLKSAEEHYNEVAANNFGYEDIAQRLENLNRRP